MQQGGFVPALVKTVGPPLSITRAGNQTILKWQGGSGVYQLQSSTSLPGGTWQNVGSATTNTSATNIASSTLFFRVQNLPQP